MGDEDENLDDLLDYEDEDDNVLSNVLGGDNDLNDSLLDDDEEDDDRANEHFRRKKAEPTNEDLSRDSREDIQPRKKQRVSSKYHDYGDDRQFSSDREYGRSSKVRPQGYAQNYQSWKNRGPRGHAYDGYSNGGNWGHQEDNYGYHSNYYHGRGPPRPYVPRGLSPRGPPRGLSPRGPPRGLSPRGPPRGLSPRGPSSMTTPNVKSMANAARPQIHINSGNVGWNQYRKPGTTPKNKESSKSESKLDSTTTNSTDLVLTNVSTAHSIGKLVTFFSEYGEILNITKKTTEVVVQFGTAAETEKALKDTKPVLNDKTIVKQQRRPDIKKKPVFTPVRNKTWTRPGVEQPKPVPKELFKAKLQEKLARTKLQIAKSKMAVINEQIQKQKERLNNFGSIVSSEDKANVLSKITSLTIQFKRAQMDIKDATLKVETALKSKKMITDKIEKEEEKSVKEEQVEAIVQNDTPVGVVQHGTSGQGVQGDTSIAAAQGDTSNVTVRNDTPDVAVQSDISNTAAQGDTSNTTVQNDTPDVAAQNDISNTAVKNDTSNTTHA